MKKGYQFLFLALLALLSACEDSGSKPEFEDIPVLQGYLIAGQPFEITISRQSPFDEDAVYADIDVDSLTVLLTYEDTSVTLLPQGLGVYHTPNDLVVQQGGSYHLSFMYNGTEISATTTIPSKPMDFSVSDSTISVDRIDFSGGMPGGPPGEMPDPIVLRWTNSDDSYYLVLAECIESDLDPIADFGDNDPPDFQFRKEPERADSSALNSREFSYFGTHRVVLFHLNVDYASLYDDASTSSLNLTNPSTSIVNGYGIFTGISTDTMYIDVLEN